MRASADGSRRPTKTKIMSQNQVMLRRPARVYRGSTASSLRQTITYDQTQKKTKKIFGGFPISKAMMTTEAVETTRVEDDDAEPLLKHFPTTSDNEFPSQISLDNEQKHISMNDEGEFTANDSYFGIISLRQSEGDRDDNKNIQDQVRSRQFILCQQDNSELNTKQPSDKDPSYQEDSHDYMLQASPQTQPPVIETRRVDQSQKNNFQVSEEFLSKLQDVLNHRKSSMSSEEQLAVCKGEWKISEQATEPVIAQTRSEFFSTYQFKTTQTIQPNKLNQKLQKRKQRQMKKSHKRSQSLKEQKAKVQNQPLSSELPLKFFGIVDKQRNRTSSITEAFGGRPATQLALRSSIQGMRKQLQTPKQQQSSSAAQEPQINKLSDKSITEHSFVHKANAIRVNFQHFKKQQVVNTLLGAAQNPMVASMANEKMDSIRTRLGYVPDMNLKFSSSTGQAQSIDLNNFATVKNRSIIGNSIPIVNNTNRRANAKTINAEAACNFSILQSANHSAHVSSQDNKSCTSQLDSTQQRITEVKLFDQDPFMGQKRRMRSMKSSQTSPQECTVKKSAELNHTGRIRELWSKRWVCKEQVQQGYSTLQKIDLKPKEKEFLMRKRIPNARLPNTRGQWDLKVNHDDEDTVAFNPQLTFTNLKPVIAARKAQMSFLQIEQQRKKETRRAELASFGNEYMAKIDEVKAQEDICQKIVDNEKKKMLAAENVGSDDELIQQVLQTSTKMVEKITRKKHNLKRDHLIAGFIQKQEEKKRLAEEEEREAELRNMDGDKESFHSGQVVSAQDEEDEKAMNKEGARLEMEAKIEKKLLRRMHEHGNAKKDQFQNALGEVQVRKRRSISKKELSSPERRLKRFISEFNDDESLYETVDDIIDNFNDANLCAESDASFDDMTPRHRSFAHKRLSVYLDAHQLLLFRQRDFLLRKYEEKMKAKRRWSKQIKDRDNAMLEKNADNENAQAIINIMKFKEASSAQVDGADMNDPNFIYQRRIQEEGEVLLPLINKITNRKFILKDYTLNIGHCRALVEVWQKLGLPEVDIVYLANCGFDDEQFSTLLTGFATQKCLQLLYYKNGSLGPLSMKAIEPLIIKRYPNHLRSLKLVKLNTSSVFINELLDLLIDHTSNINSLSLVELQLSTANISKIIECLDWATGLEELDLSWNNFIPADFDKLTDYLQNNTTLRILNLSWNMMIPQSDQKELSEFKYPKRMQMEKFFTRDPWNLNHTELMADRFSKLVRHNTLLQHLDLTNTGLNEVFLFDMLPALRRAKSLLAFHIGVNPGITERITEYYHKKLRITPKKDPLNIQVIREKNNFQIALQATANSFLSQKMIDQFQILSKQMNQRQVEETYELGQVKQNLMVNSLSQVTVKTSSADMSIYRVLGHKIDVPGSGQWCMQTNSDENNCWCCNGSIYSLIFWKSDMGEFHEIMSNQLNDEEKNRIINCLEIQNQEEYETENPPPTDVPVLYSNCTSWTARPFQSLFDFLKLLKQEELDFAGMAENKMKECQLFKHGFDEYTKDDMKSWSEAETQKNKDQHKENLLKNHMSIIKQKLTFKQPNLINYELMDDPANTYVLPIFIRPGRTHFFIREPREESKEKKYFYSRHIVQTRKEALPKFSKQLQKEIHSKIFIKEHSVFRNWKEDTSATIKTCLKHDFGYWKVPKFIKDESEVKACEEIITRNFLLLKEVFLQTVGKGGTPPDLSQLEFHHFCTEAKIFDSAMQPSFLDIAFAATNYEEDEQDGNDDRALIRFEFLEIIVRIVRKKYFETKKTATIAEGLQCFIKEHIMPMQDFFCEWQTFRYEQLWDLDVDKLFKKNMTHLESLYDALCKSRKKSTKVLSYNNLVELMQHPKINLGLSQKYIQQAFILSKMTVEKENELGPKEYQCIKFVEFIEFIGRLANQKWIGTERQNTWPLHKKIFDILTSLFKFIEEEPNDSQSCFTQISDSDEDY